MSTFRFDEASATGLALKTLTSDVRAALIDLARAKWMAAVVFFVIGVLDVLDRDWFSAFFALAAAVLWAWDSVSTHKRAFKYAAADQ